MTTCIPSLASSAIRRLRLLRFRCTRLRLTDARLLHTLIRTCVFSSLSWGAPLWTPFAIPSLDDPGQAAPLERVFRSFLQWLLRVRRTCPLEILYHETGSLPQFLRLLRMTLRYFLHLRSLPGTSLARQAFRVDLALAATDYASWSRHIYLYVSRQIQLDAYIPDDRTAGWEAAVDPDEFLEAISARFTCRWASRRPGSRSEFYFTHIEHCPGLPAYLCTVALSSLRHLLTRFWTGLHDLRVEVDRHSRLPRAARLCQHCLLGAVKDEIHFVFHCPAYYVIRGRYHCLFAAHYSRRGLSDLHSFLAYPDQHCVASYIHETLVYRRTLIPSP